MTGASATAGKAISDYSLMSRFQRGGGIDFFVNDSGSADTGADGEIGDAVVCFSGSEYGLSQAGQVGIVFHKNRSVKTLVYLFPNRLIAPVWQVGAGENTGFFFV